MIDKTKVCKTCGVEKDIKLFPSKKGGKLGVGTNCKSAKEIGLGVMKDLKRGCW